ncbi:MBL fold metallo-hydrolase [Tenacibaculum maritimum]|nr:MBL fold metallo-hydrolase [Tenacibaculum maritimum]MDB0602112.1 MBL fold metallo-hydrolase [Tenacibaculum maritimum]MDB0610802.1 MBL fold metallo-hydrolase [Tenacibaculum maritimum]
MKLKVIGSNSKGNSYLLENKDEALLIECGVNLSKIKEAINFNISKIAGCIVTHEHKDHCVAINDVLKAGINVFATEGTHEACETTMHHRSGMFGTDFKPIQIGGFKVMAFDVKHDANEPCGFLINHPDSGNVLFLTDTYYSPYTFRNLNNIIIEANYSKKIINDKMGKGSLPEFLRNRIFKSHMSLETCIKSLKANDLRAVNNIVLIHLSDGNSDENYFLNEVKKVTSKNVTVANAGIQINFNKNPF